MPGMLHRPATLGGSPQGSTSTRHTMPPPLTGNAQTPGNLNPEELQWLMQDVQRQGQQPLGSAPPGPARPAPGMPPLR